MNWKNILIGFGLTFFFSILYFFGIFDSLGYQVYDSFLYFRAPRERIKDVVFLNVDDNAIAYNGVFPWPRSIPADGLLRLKEYGARSLIFDIEFIDRGPQGVDTLYLNTGLPADFGRSSSQINTVVSDLFSALGSGRRNLEDIDELSQTLSQIINSEIDGLFNRAQSIARDNDKYLIQASALFGRSWSTLNLSNTPLSGEQAERRFMAEELFSHPILAAPRADRGENSEILPALPGLSRAAKGAGFTNVEIDSDGVRRRIRMVQNIHDHWYLQLALAPLLDYLGNPEVEYDNQRMILRNALMPSGQERDIRIPLDGSGRMLLDWPREDYLDSYEHISFANFSLLEDIEAEMEYFARLLAGADIVYFSHFDPSIVRIPFITSRLTDLFDEIRDLKAAALEYTSDEYFDAYVEIRRQSRVLMREILDLEVGAKVEALAPNLAEADPWSAEIIYEEASYISTLAEFLKISLDRYEELSAEIEALVRDRFAILGRSDTGTTDIGVNPFHGQYVNVGTHGVILDMILSDVFIVPVARHWHILFSLLFVPLFFFVSVKFSPVKRAAAGFLAGILVFAASAFLFRFSGIFFNPLLAGLSMVVAVTLREIVSYAGSEREKQFIRKAFSTYLSPGVVSELISDPSKLNLGGDKRDMTVLFTDLKGFSTFSEKMDPSHLVRMLNKYLTAMSNIIMDNQGTIDKYIGDAIVAFFGAPIYREDHAALACRSALAMRKAEEELNAELLSEGIISTPLFTRIGINSGEMVVGNMGSENKMNYTVMGNTVNLAARLESVNKQFETGIMISEYTQALAGPEFISRRLDRVRVVGINTPLRLYELLYGEGEMDEAKRKWVNDWEESIDQLESRQFSAAARLFGALKEQHPEDGVAGLYALRSESYIKEAPDPGWDGVNDLTEK